MNNTSSDINQIEVLYEDNHLIIVNKAASEIVQGDKTGDETMIDRVKDYIKHKHNKTGNVFLGLIHRLDRPVSGIVIFAKTSKALSRMNNLFKERHIEKKYLAIVKNKPPQHNERITHHLVRDNKKNKSFAYLSEKPNSKKAILEYSIIGQSKTFFLLEITLETGRHHQIRTQLSKINCPIKGDLKYGYPRSNTDASISLHAVSVSFKHPVNDTIINVSAPLPKNDIWEIFSNDIGIN